MNSINGLNSSQELAIFPLRVLRPVIRSVDVVPQILERSNEIGIAHSFPQNILVVSNFSRNSLSPTAPIAAAVPIQSVDTVQVNSIRIRNRNIKPILQDFGIIFGVLCIWAIGYSMLFRFYVYPNR